MDRWGTSFFAFDHELVNGFQDGVIVDAHFFELHCGQEKWSASGQASSRRWNRYMLTVWHFDAVCPLVVGIGVREENAQDTHVGFHHGVEHIEAVIFSECMKKVAVGSHKEVWQRRNGGSWRS